MLRSGSVTKTVSIRRNLHQPSGAGKYAEAIFTSVLKLPTVRDPELEILRKHYEGDHETLIRDSIQKPPSWDDTTWAYVQKDLLHINSTRTSLKTLQTGIYSTQPVRKIQTKGTVGPFAKQLSQEISRPEWRRSMKRLSRDVILYGTGYMAPDYDPETREFNRRHLNPVTTHVLVNSSEPEVPVVVCEFDEQRNWVRIWTREFYAMLSRDPDDVDFVEWVDPAGEVAEKPYFPVVVAKTEDIPGSPYGLSLLRDTPRFNRCLSVSYFNLAFSAKIKALALLTITSGDGTEEVTADLTQLGPHTSLVLPKGAAAAFLESHADLSGLVEIINQLRDLESYVLGCPTVEAERNMSAKGAEAASQPLTSQLSELADTAAINEVRAMIVTAQDAHFEVGSIATEADVRRLYAPAVKLKPSFNREGLQSRQQSLTQLAKDRLIPAEDAVAEFNEDMSFEEVEAQAVKFLALLDQAIATTANKSAEGQRTASSGS